MTKKSLFSRVFFVFIIFIALNSILISEVYGVSLGVSPGRVNFNNLLKDGYAEQYVTISTSLNDRVTAHFDISGDIADWVNFEPEEKEFAMSYEEPYRLKVIVTPPGDVAVGAYYGTLTYTTDQLGSVNTGMGSAIRAEVISTIEIRITDEQIIGCRAGAIQIADVEEGYPLELRFSVENKGNVRLRPVVILEVLDQLQKSVVISKELVGEEVLPTTLKNYVMVIDDQLEAGQYWASVTIKSTDENNQDCMTQKLITFSVVERGGIADQGTLEKVSSKTWVFVGEIIPIIATFYNNGERNVDARFKGEVVKDENIVKLLESDALRVNPGENVELTTYFEPQDPGRYVVNGRVLYNNKLTFEKGTIINVNSPPKVEGIKIIPIILYLAILMIILVLIHRIRKEKAAIKRWKKRR